MAQPESTILELIVKNKDLHQATPKLSLSRDIETQDFQKFAKIDYHHFAVNTLVSLVN